MSCRACALKQAPIWYSRLLPWIDLVGFSETGFFAGTWCTGQRLQEECKKLTGWLACRHTFKPENQVLVQSLAFVAVSEADSKRTGVRGNHCLVEVGAKGLLKALNEELTQRYTLRAASKVHEYVSYVLHNPRFFR